MYGLGTDPVADLTFDCTYTSDGTAMGCQQTSRGGTGSGAEGATPFGSSDGGSILDLLGLGPQIAPVGSGTQLIPGAGGAGLLPIPGLGPFSAPLTSSPLFQMPTWVWWVIGGFVGLEVYKAVK